MTTVQDKPQVAAWKAVNDGKVLFDGHTWSVEYTEDPERSTLKRNGVVALMMVWDGFPDEEFVPLVEAVMRMQRGEDVRVEEAL